MKLHITRFLYVTCYVALMVSCAPKDDDTVGEIKPKTLSKEDLIRRGKYLTAISGCNDCHSPKIMTPLGPEPDTSRLLSGHPQHDPTLPMIKENPGWILFGPDLTTFVGPWGTSYAANLTPDETGIGNWSYKQFQTALRKGKYKGLESGRTLLPPMPWQMYRNMSDEDIQAVFAYLKSLKPVSNIVPAPVPPSHL